MSNATATVTLSGVPTGVLEFWYSEVADGPEFACPFVAGGTAGTYVLTLPYPDIWFIWAKDGNGFGAQYSACYVGPANDEEADRIGLFIRQTLEDNKRGIEAMMRTWYPNTSLKGVHYGFPSSILNFPSILVSTPRYDWNWKATGYVSEWNYRFTIAFMADRSEEQTETPLVTRMAQAGMRILNRRRYTRFAIGEMNMYHCMAREGESTEVEVENGFAAIATCVWTGKMLKQQGNGQF